MLDNYIKSLAQCIICLVAASTANAKPNLQHDRYYGSPRWRLQAKRLAFAPDNVRLAAANDWLRILDRRTGKLLHQSNLWTSAVDWQRRSLVVVDKDFTILLLDSKSYGVLKRKKTSHSKYDKVKMRLSADGRRLLTADDQTLRLWTVPGLALLRTYKARSKVLAVDLGPKGRVVLAGQSEGYQRWRTRDGAELSGGKRGEVTAIVAMSGGGYVYAVDRFLFSVKGRRRWRKAYAWDMGCLALRLGRHGNLYAADGIGHVLQIDARTGRQRQAMRWRAARPSIHDDEVGLAITRPRRSADVRIAASGRVIRLWNPARKKREPATAGHADHIDSVAITDNSKRVATGSRDRRIMIWDATSGKLLRTLATQKRWATSLWFAGNHTLFSVAGSTVIAWDVTSGKQRGKLELKELTVRTARAADGGLWITHDSKLTLWRKDGTKQTRDLGLGEISSLVSSPDKSQVLVSPAGRGTIFRLRSFQDAPKRIVKISSSTDVMAWSKDNLIAASVFNGAVVIDVRHQKILRTMPGAVSSMVFSPTGKLLASALGDRLILRRVRDGKIVSSFVIDGTGEEVRFSTNGQFLVGSLGLYAARWKLR